MLQANLFKIALNRTKQLIEQAENFTHKIFANWALVYFYVKFRRKF